MLTRRRLDVVTVAPCRCRPWTPLVASIFLIRRTTTGGAGLHWTGLSVRWQAHFKERAIIIAVTVVKSAGSVVMIVTVLLATVVTALLIVRLVRGITLIGLEVRVITRRVIGTRGVLLEFRSI